MPTLVPNCWPYVGIPYKGALAKLASCSWDDDRYEAGCMAVLGQRALTIFTGDCPGRRARRAMTNFASAYQHLLSFLQGWAKAPREKLAKDFSKYAEDARGHLRLLDRAYRRTQFLPEIGKRASAMHFSMQEGLSVYHEPMVHPIHGHSIYNHRNAPWKVNFRIHDFAKWVSAAGLPASEAASTEMAWRAKDAFGTAVGLVREDVMLAFEACWLADEWEWAYQLAARERDAVLNPQPEDL
jgi:hypothetical protein